MTVHVHVHVYMHVSWALTIRDIPHERCIGVDVDDWMSVGGGGQAKVTNLNVTGRVEKDVPWFQVTVNHTL